LAIGVRCLECETTRRSLARDEFRKLKQNSALSLPQSLDPVRRLHATDKPAFVKPSDEPVIVCFSSVRLADVAAGSVAPISALLPQS
jgi:hypothetical protein